MWKAKPITQDTTEEMQVVTDPKNWVDQEHREQGSNDIHKDQFGNNNGTTQQIVPKKFKQAILLTKSTARFFSKKHIWQATWLHLQYKK